jgi:hypothetical protein
MAKLNVGHGQTQWSPLGLNCDKSNARVQEEEVQKKKNYTRTMC